LEQTSEWTPTKITGTKIGAMANQGNAALAWPILLPLGRSRWLTGFSWTKILRVWELDWANSDIALDITQAFYS